MSGRFQIAIHILTLLDKADGKLLSSQFIAGSLNANPALVRKELSNLNKFGFVNSREGQGGGYSLGKRAADITLADVFRTVQTGSVLGSTKNQPNPACSVGKQINQNISKFYDEIDNVVIGTLANTTLANFSSRFN
ncbi:Rrf2 family transcriptional regulator [Mucilaginibacter pallidiroseus]|uniref:Rrf2 family transcriptional regulator n=1 Tax=Mucilaginibacter pallidiroseus TaxID=2599295 RepID=A0A563UK00_9SPHI|nr:Rrf2 family transcriptional regulator [Mucilaginibacter pallidiroseus]TWR31663.1 Rrf2 family transcriptional regulator [Mucilaginibacter pallidiroseus]